MGGGAAKGPKKSHSSPMRSGPSRPPHSEDTFFFQRGGHLMSLFLPFVWLCRQPSVAAWPLSSPSPSSPFPLLLTSRKTFPWKRAPRGGGGESCGSGVAIGEKGEKIHNRPSQGAVTKRGCEWRCGRGSKEREKRRWRSGGRHFALSGDSLFPARACAVAQATIVWPSLAPRGCGDLGACRWP